MFNYINFKNQVKVRLCAYVWRKIKTYEEYVFNYEEAYTLLTRHFKVSNLEPFGLEGQEMAIQAADE